MMFVLDFILAYKYKGLCKEKNQKFRDYYGSGWVGPVTILGTKNCQSILFQSLLGASHLFMLCDTVKRDSKVLPDYCTPHNLPFISLWPAKHTGLQS